MSDEDDVVVMAEAALAAGKLCADTGSDSGDTPVVDAGQWMLTWRPILCASLTAPDTLALFRNVVFAGTSIPSAASASPTLPVADLPRALHRIACRRFQFSTSESAVEMTSGELLAVSGDTASDVGDDHSQFLRRFYTTTTVSVLARFDRLLRTAFSLYATQFDADTLPATTCVSIRTGLCAVRHVSVSFVGAMSALKAFFIIPDLVPAHVLRSVYALSLPPHLRRLQPKCDPGLDFPGFCELLGRVADMARTAVLTGSSSSSSSAARRGGGTDPVLEDLSPKMEALCRGLEAAVYPHLNATPLWVTKPKSYLRPQSASVPGVRSSQSPAVLVDDTPARPSTADPATTATTAQTDKDKDGGTTATAATTTTSPSPSPSPTDSDNPTVSAPSPTSQPRTQSKPLTGPSISPTPTTHTTRRASFASKRPLSAPVRRRRTTINSRPGAGANLTLSYSRPPSPKHLKQSSSLSRVGTDTVSPSVVSPFAAEGAWMPMRRAVQSAGGPNPFPSLNIGSRKRESLRRPLRYATRPKPRVPKKKGSGTGRSSSSSGGRGSRKKDAPPPAPIPLSYALLRQRESFQSRALPLKVMKGEITLSRRPASAPGARSNPKPQGKTNNTKTKKKATPAPVAASVSSGKKGKKKAVGGGKAVVDKYGVPLPMPAFQLKTASPMRVATAVARSRNVDRRLGSEARLYPPAPTPPPPPKRSSGGGDDDHDTPARPPSPPPHPEADLKDVFRSVVTAVQTRADEEEESKDRPGGVDSDTDVTVGLSSSASSAHPTDRCWGSTFKGKPGFRPSLIREAPPPLLKTPFAIASLLLAASQLRDGGDFDGAVRTYEDAHSQWLEEYPAEWTPESDACMHIMIGDAEETADRMSKAHGRYLTALAITTKLPRPHRVHAAALMRIGAASTYAGDFGLAVRSFGSALLLREQLGGGDQSLDTHTARHNLGVAMTLSGEAEEGLLALQTSTDGIVALCGPVHPRAAAAIRNLDKVRAYGRYLALATRRPLQLQLRPDRSRLLIDGAYSIQAWAHPVKGGAGGKKKGRKGKRRK